jgi:hypothetical protein
LERSEPDSLGEFRVPELERGTTLLREPEFERGTMLLRLLEFERGALLRLPEKPPLKLPLLRLPEEP